MSATGIDGNLISSKVSPCYFAIDVSAAMAGERIAAMNDLVPALLDLCHSHHPMADLLRISVITVGNNATVVNPMGAYEAVKPPALRVSGCANYGALFRLLRAQIDHDVEALKVPGDSVMRPTVFLFGAGYPIDDGASRAAAFAALSDPAWRANPNIWTFGLDRTAGDGLACYARREGHALFLREGLPATTVVDGLCLLLATAMTGRDGHHGRALPLFYAPTADDCWPFEPAAGFGDHRV